MKAKEFKKLLKEDKPKHIIAMHCDLRIFLTSKQLDEVLKRKKEEEHGRKLQDRSTN